MTTLKKDARANARTGEVSQEKPPGKAGRRTPKTPAASKAKKTAPAPNAEKSAPKGRKTEDGKAKDSSKAAQVIELLKRPKGATLDDIMEATGWQAHSVRGFLSGALRKRLGLTVESTKTDGGKRIYTIAG
jgi:hypothetical protein